MAIPRAYEGAGLGTIAYTSAKKWGSGINPIHAIAAGEGRNTAPDGTDLLVPSNLVEGGWGGLADFGYSYEDQAGQWSVAEAPTEIGTANRPSWDQTEGTRAYFPSDYPHPGNRANGVPGGENIRATLHGAIAANTPNVVPTETVSEGWLNKVTDGTIEPGSGISNPEQYTVQTSMQQLHQVRAGSQRGAGSASPYRAPIASRVPGQVLKVYSTGKRLYDMYPKQQRTVYRPFWVRNAGTGHPEWLVANSKMAIDPLSRVAPPDPYQGPPIGSAVNYGYTGEDGIY